MPVLVVLGMAERLHVELEQCQKFCRLIAKRGETYINRQEMVSFAQFMLALAYLDTTTGGVAADNACIVLGERRVDELLEMLEQDRQVSAKTALLLPADAVEYLNSPGFTDQCAERFREMDVQSKGDLEPADLFHLVSDLSGADMFAVSIEHCERFVTIFGTNSQLHQEEFLALAKHLATMAFLHSERGRDHLDWALQSISAGPGGQKSELVSQAHGLSAPVPASTKAEQEHVAFYREKTLQLEEENVALREQMLEMQEMMQKMNSNLGGSQ